MPALAAGDFLMYQGADVAADFTTSPVGGALGTQMTFGSVGEMFFSTVAQASGGSNVVEYSQCKIKNTNTTYDLVSAGGQSAGVYLKNALSAVLTAGTISVVSDSASDTGTYKIAVGGLQSALGYTESLVLNGTTPVSSAQSFDAGTYGVCWAQAQVTSSGAPTTLTGNITIKDNAGNVLGVIPAGKKSASSLCSFWVPSSLNTTDTITNAATAPAGASWGIQATPGTAQAIATGTLPHTQYQTVWTRLILPPGCPSIPDLQTDFHPVGSG